MGQILTKGERKSSHEKDEKRVSDGDGYDGWDSVSAETFVRAHAV